MFIFSEVVRSGLRVAESIDESGEGNFQIDLTLTGYALRWSRLVSINDLDIEPR